VDDEDYRRTSQEVWKAMAPGWERRRAQLAEALTPVREWLIGELRPQPGETVLELGAGVGDTGFKAAAILGERGRLVSTDFSQEMVEGARRRGTELGLGNVDYQVIDAERIELDSGSVDGVLCQSTYMLIADPAAALAETRRVLRPVGRLALSVWGAPERNPWASIGGMILIERGHMPPPEPGAPEVFSMASAERTRALLDSAGFRSVRTEEVTVRFAFRDLDDYEQWVIDVAGPSRWCSAGSPRASGRCSGHGSRRRSSPSPPTVATSFRASPSARSRAERRARQQRRGGAGSAPGLPGASAMPREQAFPRQTLTRSRRTIGERARCASANSRNR
jgi:SAM-dependent methyltransferase